MRDKRPVLDSWGAVVFLRPGGPCLCETGRNFCGVMCYVRFSDTASSVLLTPQRSAAEAAHYKAAALLLVVRGHPGRRARSCRYIRGDRPISSIASRLRRVVLCPYGYACACIYEKPRIHLKKALVNPRYTTLLLR